MTYKEPRDSWEETVRKIEKRLEKVARTGTFLPEDPKEVGHANFQNFKYLRSYNKKR